MPSPDDHGTRPDWDCSHGLDGLEVDQLDSSPATTTAFDEAENRLHAVEAVLVVTLED
ncbi:hypothetical protein [Streptomyces sp. NPDC050287]|uniref:hypothetical protein n=1 Tax=Streptomyces sp. NPDC050287 TaxID=3365608 RepID=UPI0037B4F971